MTRVLGIDGCDGGWIGIWLEDGAYSLAARSDSLAALIQQSSAQVIGIDIPLRLTTTSYRRADEAAREALGRRSSTLFMIPPRAVLEEPTHAAACAKAVALGLKRPSIQAYGLRAKIFEADALLQSHSLYEVHPELAFLQLHSHSIPRKKSWNGLHTRLAALRSVGITIPDHIDDAGNVGIDDIVDAAAVAWVASKIAAGKATCVPANANDDEATICF